MDEHLIDLIRDVLRENDPINRCIALGELYVALGGDEEAFNEAIRRDAAMATAST